MSERATTAPGVTARSRPTSNASGATMAGTRGGADRSDTIDRSPSAALRPRLPMTAFQAAGLISGLLLGATASMRLLSTNRIRSVSRQSSSASASSDSTVPAQAR